MLRRLGASTGPLPKWYLKAALGGLVAKWHLVTFICPSLAVSILANYDRLSNEPLLGQTLTFLLPTWLAGVISTLGPVKCHCWAKLRREIGKFEMPMYGASTQTTLSRFECWYWPSNIGRLLAATTGSVLGRVFISGNSHLGKCPIVFAWEQESPDGKVGIVSDFSNGIVPRQL